jgi:hypothetical protein
MIVQAATYDRRRPSHSEGTSGGLGSPYSARRREGADHAPMIAELRGAGTTSLRGIAAELTGPAHGKPHR